VTRGAISLRAKSPAISISCCADCVSIATSTPYPY
jgi:hypothetical protein